MRRARRRRRRRPRRQRLDRARGAARTPPGALARGGVRDHDRVRRREFVMAVTVPNTRRRLENWPARRLLPRRRRGPRSGVATACDSRAPPTPLGADDGRPQRERRRALVPGCRAWLPGGRDRPRSPWRSPGTRLPIDVCVRSAPAGSATLCARGWRVEINTARAVGSEGCSKLAADLLQTARGAGHTTSSRGGRGRPPDLAPPGWQRRLRQEAGPRSRPSGTRATSLRADRLLAGPLADPAARSAVRRKLRSRCAASLDPQAGAAPSSSPDPRRARGGRPTRRASRPSPPRPALIISPRPSPTERPASTARANWASSWRCVSAASTSPLRRGVAVSSWARSIENDVGSSATSWSASASVRATSGRFSSCAWLRSWSARGRAGRLRWRPFSRSNAATTSCQRRRSPFARPSR